MKEMKKLVENYKRNEDLSDTLHKRLIKLLDYNTKVTAAYGHNTGGGKGTVSSKVERHALKIKETEEKILAVEEKLYMVNHSEKVLNKAEREVIDMIKSGKFEKLTHIAKVLGKEKKYVYDTRDRAIKKMHEYMILENITKTNRIMVQHLVAAKKFSNPKMYKEE